MEKACRMFGLDNVFSFSRMHNYVNNYFQLHKTSLAAGHDLNEINTIQRLDDAVLLLLG